MIAALYVKEGGPYYDLPGVDPWPESRDARNYPGPWPVVAHPPCSRWCRLAGLVEARYGHKVGEDGGCFASALEAVRRWGGVLEHPAFTKAWTAHGLPRPATYHGWHPTFCGGWVCYVEQHRYGHPAKKATWLYAHGMERPPELRWGFLIDQKSTALVSWCGNAVASGEVRPRVGKDQASKTPTDFRDALLSIAAGSSGGRSGGQAWWRGAPKSERSRTPVEFRGALLSIAKASLEPAAAVDAD